MPTATAKGKVAKIERYKKKPPSDAIPYTCRLCACVRACVCACVRVGVAVSVCMSQTFAVAWTPKAIGRLRDPCARGQEIAEPMEGL